MIMIRLLIIFLLSLIFCSAFSQYQVNWHNIQGFDLNSTTNELTKVNSNGWNTTALSTNKLKANTDGLFRYTITGNESIMILGFSEYNTSTHPYDSKFRFYLNTYGNSNYVKMYYNNYTVLNTYNNPQVGDTLILERAGSTINYKVHKLNGTQVLYATAGTNPNEDLYVDVNAHYENSNINNVECSFSEGATIEQETLHNQNTTNNTLGSIDVNVTGQQPIVYNWSNGATTEDLSGLSAGIYTLTITDNAGDIMTRSFEVIDEHTTQTNWHNVQGYNVNGTTNELTKFYSNSWNTTALSTNKLKPNTDGLFRYVIMGNEVGMVIGFSEHNISTHPYNAKFRFYINTYGNSNYTKAFYTDYTVFGTDYDPQIGDTLILERRGNKINYRIHKYDGNQILYSSATTDPAKTLYIDVSSAYENSNVNSMVCSFSEGVTIEQEYLHHQNITSNTLGSIAVNVTGQQPITYNWSNGATVQDISGLSAGVYTLIVTDNTGESFTSSFEIRGEKFYQTTWQDVQGYSLNTTTNELTKSTANGWNSTALSTNELKANTNGSLKYVITGNETTMIIGFSEYNTSTHPYDSKYRFYLNTNGNANYLKMYLNNYTVLNTYNNPQVGDTIILERIGSIIYYRVHKADGTQTLYAGASTNPSEVLYIDVNSPYVPSVINNMVCTFYTPLNIPYYPLSMNLSGGYYDVLDDELHFSYYERYTPSNGGLNYEIIDNTGTVVTASLPFLPIVQGENYLSLDFSSLGLSSGYYILRVTNEKDEVKQLRFKL